MRSVYCVLMIALFASQTKAFGKVFFDDSNHRTKKILRVVENTDLSYLRVETLSNRSGAKKLFTIYLGWFKYRNSKGNLVAPVRSDLIKIRNELSALILKLVNSNKFNLYLISTNCSLSKIVIYNTSKKIAEEWFAYDLVQASSYEKINQLVDSSSEPLNPLSCRVCFSNDRDILFFPCHHFAICSICNANLEKRECPICKSKIEKTEKVVTS